MFNGVIVEDWDRTENGFISLNKRTILKGTFPLSKSLSTHTIKSYPPTAIFLKIHLKNIKLQCHPDMESLRD